MEEHKGTSKHVIWENKEIFGCEHLKLGVYGQQIEASGNVIYIDEAPYHVDYLVYLDEKWITKKLNISVLGEKNLEIYSNGNDRWFTSDDTELAQLKGAIDIDIACTPFSNTLPINRYQWFQGQEREFEMVYVNIPSLRVEKVSQKYKLLKDHGQVRIFHYHCRDYQTQIKVDEKGLVIEYPGVFLRRY